MKKILKTRNKNTKFPKFVFTLIELLAVIVILAIIALIAIPIVINIINDSKKSSQIESIKMYAKMVEKAASSYIMKYPKDNDITIDKLNDENLIQYKGDPINCEIVQIWNDGKIYVGDCTVGGIEVDYSYGEYKTIPELDNGLTPVVYVDESTEEEPTKGYWKVVDKSDPTWYDYDNQKWANAVVLSQTAKNNNKNEPGSIVTVDGNNSDVLMMMVWIPRYEYKIEGKYGKGGTSTTNPGEIEVNFIPPTKLKSSKDYILHPAFEFGNNESDMNHLSGIWMGKFELSRINNYSNLEYMRVLPNLQSYKSYNISSDFDKIKQIENSNMFNTTNIDSHMMKNSEWGAVAYLSQSKYGKYGNKNYTGANKEIYQNKSNNYITGLSNGTPSQSGTNTQCVYNDMTDLGTGKGVCGPGASTTGTIYGIYDMSGGRQENVMGVYKNEEGIYVGHRSDGKSGFNGKILNAEDYTSGEDLPEQKYYDVYENPSNQDYSGLESCNNGMCYGGALSETKNWYEDEYRLMIMSYPWIYRGYLSNRSDGIFSYGHTCSGAYNSTRVVFVSK